MTVFRAFPFLPLAFIAEAVSKSLSYRVECQPQKSQITSGEVRRTGWNTASQFFQQNRDDERASIVVRRISFRIVWHGEYCVLYHSSMVSHLQRMTDHTGMVEHAVFTVPNYPEGYSTDDNARALIVTILLEELGSSIPAGSSDLA